MPHPPSTIPDPRGHQTFAEWLKVFTKRGNHYGVTQRMIAAVTNATPQAVTKWLKGGSIEVERLARLAAWIGVPYLHLQTLANEERLRTLPPGAFQELDTKAVAPVPADLARIWEVLTPVNRKQLLAVAKVLQANQGPKKR